MLVVNIMRLEKINLADVISESSRIYVKLNKKFLIKILNKASKDKKPHKNRDFCEKIGVQFNDTINASSTVIAWIRFNRAIPLSKLLVIRNISNIPWKIIEDNILNLKSSLSGGEINIRFPLNIGFEMGSIIGHIIGDGSIDKKHKQVFYSNSNKELLNEFYNYMKFIFKIYPRIWMQKTSTFKGKTQWDKRLNKIDELLDKRNCGLFYPTICGSILNIIFNNFSIGRNKKITDKIKKTNKEFKAGLIRAFFDDESNVGKKSIRVFQDKKDILDNIRTFLTEFGIYTKEVKEYIKLDKSRYYLDIHRKSNLNKFREEIGFTSKIKMNKLKEICIIKNYKNSK